MRTKLSDWAVRAMLVFFLLPAGVIWWLGHPPHPGHSAELGLVLGVIIGNLLVVSRSALSDALARIGHRE